MDPGLAAEAKSCVEAGNRHTHDADEACKEAVVCSHAFFTVASEELFVRPLAIRLGYLGADAEVSVDIGGRLSVLVPVCDEPNSYEAFKSVKDEFGNIRGLMRVPFPADGPNCKYAALFDLRKIFDPLRQAFLTYGDPTSRPDTLLRHLQEWRPRHD